MDAKTCLLIGAPMDCGKRRRGCVMGPDSYRTAGIHHALGGLGHRIEDRGNIAPAPWHEGTSDMYAQGETLAWAAALQATARDAMTRGFPIFMGGDHAISLGTVPGVAAHAADMGRPQFLLWLDAHSDFHTPQTSQSGNLHGTPVAYATGQPGFDGFPPPAAVIPPQNTCLLGLRSVDPPEATALAQTPITTIDMRMIDETGIKPPLMAFLERAGAQHGLLHVSLDVDFLDPAIAPAVGTTVPGGATARESHLVMELLHDSGLVSSLDLVELNPFLDERGRTASLIVDLAASLLGRRVFDRPTRGFF